MTQGFGDFVCQYGLSGVAMACLSGVYGLSKVRGLRLVAVVSHLVVKKIVPILSQVGILI